MTRPRPPLITPPGSIPALGSQRSVASPPPLTYAPQAVAAVGSPGLGPGMALSDHVHASGEPPLTPYRFIGKFTAGASTGHASLSNDWPVLTVVEDPSASYIANTFTTPVDGSWDVSASCLVHSNFTTDPCDVFIIIGQGTALNPLEFIQNYTVIPPNTNGGGGYASLGIACSGRTPVISAGKYLSPAVSVPDTGLFNGTDTYFVEAYLQVRFLGAP